MNPDKDEIIHDYSDHHEPRRHKHKHETVFEDCPFGQCRLIDNEFVELCAACEWREQEHEEAMK